jgi:Trypsin
MALRAWGMTAILVCGCSAGVGDAELASRQDPIYGGTADATHDAIVALLHVERNKAGACTGTTIAKQGGSGILLTAAHCVVAMDANDNVVIPVQRVDPGVLEVIGGADWSTSYQASKTFGVAEVTIHPQFDGNVQSPFDVAVVRYLGATAATQIIPALSPAEDKLMVGSTVTLYGYGSTESNVDNTQRRKVDKTIQNLNARQVVYDQTDGKGTCRGDSGGPALVNVGGERVAAVTSFGDQDCTQLGVSVRVSSVSSFLQGALAKVPAALTCDECRTASIGPMSPCFAQRAACSGTSPCSRFYDCVAPCTNSACYDACTAKNSAGAQAFDALGECECTAACPTECANDTSCGAPACGGLSAPGAVCASCIQQNCCHEAELCAANAGCAACFRHAGMQCGTDALYNGLLGCVSRCNANPCKVALGASGSVDAGVGSDAAAAALTVDGEVPIQYQAASPAVAASEGGCSCRQAPSDSRAPGRALMASTLVALAAMRVRSGGRARRRRLSSAR